MEEEVGARGGGVGRSSVQLRGRRVPTGTGTVWRSTVEVRGGGGVARAPVAVVVVAVAGRRRRSKAGRGTQQEDDEAASGQETTKKHHRRRQDGHGQSCSSSEAQRQS